MLMTMRVGTITAATILLCALAGTAAAFDIPTNEGLVTDTIPSTVLTTEQKDALSQQLLGYQKATGQQIAVLIVRTLGVEPPSFVARQVGGRWGVGSDAQQAGVLLIIAYDDGIIHIAPGTGLRGVLPDVVTQGIVEQEVLPLWREGLYAQAVGTAVLAVQRHLNGEYPADRYDAPLRGNVGVWMKFVLFLGIAAGASVIGRHSRWRLGGVAGALLGCWLVITDGWWLAIPSLSACGLACDVLATRNQIHRHRRRFAR